MTEDEAKTKWCPMVRMDNGSGGNYNAYTAVGVTINKGRCIGSGCMMWRENPQLWKDASGTLYSQPPKHRASEPQPITGYCGLAGKP